MLLVACSDQMFESWIVVDNIDLSSRRKDHTGLLPLHATMIRAVGLSLGAIIVIHQTSARHQQRT